MHSEYGTIPLKEVEIITDSELLQAISNMIDEKLDQKLKPINDRLEMLEIRQELTHKKLDSLALDIKVSERSIKKDIKLLQDAEETLISVLEHNGILPTAK